MTGHLTIPGISDGLDRVTTSFVDYCFSLTDEKFFEQPAGKWSPAQQVKHLIKATDTSRLAFTLPRFILRMVGGKPNRPSRTYDELVMRYKTKLEQGGKASGRYIPKPVPPSYGKRKLLNGFSRSMQKMSKAVRHNWKEDEPDNYIAPHPLLGKITLHELGYFTIHHTEHHLESIQQIVKGQ